MHRQQYVRPVRLHLHYNNNYKCHCVNRSIGNSSINIVIIGDVTISWALRNCVSIWLEKKALCCRAAATQQEQKNKCIQLTLPPFRLLVGITDKVSNHHHHHPLGLRDSHPLNGAPTMRITSRCAPGGGVSGNSMRQLQSAFGTPVSQCSPPGAGLLLRCSAIIVRLLRGTAGYWLPVWRRVRNYISSLGGPQF